MKLSVSYQQLRLLSVIGIFLTLPSLTHAAYSYKAQPGQVRLLGAEVLEAGDYNLQTSFQFFQQDELLEDTDRSTVRRTQGYLGFGYALTPNIHLSGSGGFSIASRKPTRATTGATTGGETIDLLKFFGAAYAAYDVGSNFFGLAPKRLTAGGALEIDFSKITRFIAGPNIIPRLIVSTDFTDNQVVPYKAHLNLGFRPGNGSRYYEESDTTIKDLDRLATDTINSYAVTFATGIEFPLQQVTPSLEMHMEYVMDAGFSNSPKWITPAVKARPFSQKNIEVLLGVDVGLSSYTATPTGQKPAAPAVPLWNILLGFSVSNFGKKSNELAVDRQQFENLQTTLASREKVLAGLQQDLQYNTIQGRVIDAQTKEPIAGASLSFPDNSDFKTSTTDEEGKFIRYFKALSGNRMAISKEGYETSSKFLAMKPGERVNVDIELSKSTGEARGFFVATITDPDGLGLPAQITFTNMGTNENSAATSDAAGQVNLRVRPGSYQITIRAAGMQTITDRLEFEGGKTVLRSYSFVKDTAGGTTPTPAPTPAPAPAPTTPEIPVPPQPLTP